MFGIIKQTGGFIIPESHVGEGTVFRIYFPRYVPTAEEPALVGANAMAAVSEENAAQDLTGKAVVLLVEDEAPVRRFASRALENKGYTVLQAASAEEALDLLGDHDGSIDLVITDVVARHGWPQPGGHRPKPPTRFEGDLHFRVRPGSVRKQFKARPGIFVPTQTV